MPLCTVAGVVKREIRRKKQIGVPEFTVMTPEQKQQYDRYSTEKQETIELKGK